MTLKKESGSSIDFSYCMDNEHIPYSVYLRNVRYPRLEFITGKLIVIMPKNRACYVKELLEKKREWIRNKFSEIRTLAGKSQTTKNLGSISPNQTQIAKLKQNVKSLVAMYSTKLRISPKKLFFKRLRTKWGSCSRKGNLMFNTQLALISRRLLEHVVIHELIHLRIKRHGKEFYSLLSEHSPDSLKKEKQLEKFWFWVQS